MSSTTTGTTSSSRCRFIKYNKAIRERRNCRCPHAGIPAAIFTGFSSCLVFYRGAVFLSWSGAGGREVPYTHTHKAQAQLNRFWLFYFHTSNPFNNRQMRSYFASRRKVSKWGPVAHGAMALKPPNGVSFCLVPWQAPGLSFDPLGSDEEEGRQVKGGRPSKTLDSGPQ
jgi:hypothetical protein